jgi:hypothetical protein
LLSLRLLYHSLLSLFWILLLKMTKAQIKVEGVPEVRRALDKVDAATQDLSKVHKAEAEMLLPDVVSATRRDSGDLAAGWQTDGIATEAKFINNEVYAGVQEWGWPDHNIEPTYAITQAFEQNTDKTEALYADAIGAIGERAGFATKD